MTRFVPDSDVSDRRVHIPSSTVRWSDLHSTLRDRIAEADPSELELLEMIVAQVKIINMHLMVGSDEEITEDDIEWP